MKIKYIIFSFVAFFALTGCFEDKGNYEYKKFPDLSVALVKGTNTKIVQGESLKMVLEMRNLPEGYVSEFTYEWYRWFNGVREVVGTGDTYIFEAEKVGKFKFGYTATDVKTGAVYFSYDAIYVNPIFQRGFVILAEEEERTDMHFVVASLIQGNKDTYSNDTIIYTKEFTSIYKTMVDDPIIGKPIRITEHWGYEMPSELGELSVETQVGSDRKIIEVNGSTMERETYIEQEFIGGEVPTNFKPKKIIQAPWDSFIINEDGRVFNRRSASNKAFHLGYYDAKIPWGNKANIENIFMTHFISCDLFLAIEKDIETGKRNYVAVYEGGSNLGRSGLRVPQRLNSDLKYNDLKDEIIFDDYFKNIDDYGMNALITKNSSNQLILNILTYEWKNFEGVYYLSFIEPEVEENEKDQLYNTINLTQKFGINSLNGMFTIKTYTADKIVYMYDDHNLYYYDFMKNTFKTVHSFSNKVITAATSNSMISRDDDDFTKFEIESLSLAFGFDDGSFEVYELDVDMVNRVDKFDKLGKLVYENKANFGKIKQILYKIGSDSYGFTWTY